ncbi:MAG: OmpA family protein [Deltaproteobacteria bacterium]|nr:OmpA family protein [Deltaproteobacteria bacterium]NIS76542.1 OmpA family protein [Deltaproteobacteria bacterium]
MDRNKVGISIMAAAILALWGSWAGAEVKPGTFTVSPLVGIYTFDSEQRLEDGTLFGLRLGYNFDRHWGGELSFDYVDTEFDFVDVNAEGYLYHAEGLYHFRPEEKFVPFVAAGIGGIDIQFEGAGSSSGFLFNYGAGAKFFVGENIAIRGDIRHIIAYSDALNNFAFTLGVTYQFGKAKEPPKDSDMDGISDSEDLCPGTPSGAPVDAKGCPTDSDNDGVADYLDSCPETAAGEKVDETGCVVPEKKEVSMTLNVEFDKNSAEVKDTYGPLLEKAADFMKKYPETAAVIEGHTDSTGRAEYNLAISQKRADSVKNYLVERFEIDPSRIKAVGFGETRPVADNKTKEGRERNRRVLVIITAAPLSGQ